jgi:hypothetical protein
LHVLKKDVPRVGLLSEALGASLPTRLTMLIVG